VPAGVLDSFRVSLLGLPIEQRAYINILQSLGAGGYRDEEIGRAAIDYGGGHFTCFQFPYDWRRDNIENARKLHEFILEKKAYVESVMRKELGIENPVAKFDIVAHSMGGLVTRYYLRYGAQDLREDGSPPELTWAGAEHVERAILVGTPNAGSVYALIQLIEGIRFAPLLPSYGPGILGTMTAIYELMPRARHGALVDLEDRSVKLDPFDPALWERLGWGLASPRNDEELKALLPEAPDAAARRRIALDHLRKCLERARGFNEALDRPARPPEGLELCLFAGDAVPTPAVLGVDQKTGAVRVLETAPGDGTVPRTSALMDERVGSEWRPSLVSPVDWSRVTFLFTDHLGMTGDPAFTDNVLYLLLEDPR
jgi:pimeloyl-ACP methyl ester carboxylesterase